MHSRTQAIVELARRGVDVEARHGAADRATLVRERRVAARGIAPSLLARARADQVATLYARWHRTSVSMLLGAALLCAAMWGEASPWLMACWVALIAANQAWRGAARARVAPRATRASAAAPRWGRYWVDRLGDWPARCGARRPSRCSRRRRRTRRC